MTNPPITYPVTLADLILFADAALEEIGTRAIRGRFTSAEDKA